MAHVKGPQRTRGSALEIRQSPPSAPSVRVHTRVRRLRQRGATTEQGSEMDIVAILLALVVFALMFGLIKAMERI